MKIYEAIVLKLHKNIILDIAFRGDLKNLGNLEFQFFFFFIHASSVACFVLIYLIYTNIGAVH